MKYFLLKLPMPSAYLLACLATLALTGPYAPAQGAFGAKPLLTLDEFLNTTEIVGARISPDGAAAVIGTESPDWKSSVYRHTLWLWTVRDGLRALTQSGSDEDAEWSPDGKWIAFQSDRLLPGESAGDAGDDSTAPKEGDDDKTSRVWLIPIAGGEARPLYREKLDCHSFAWSADGKTIYFSATSPLTREQEDTRREEWKDVIRWREQERGDLLLALPVADALARTAKIAGPHDPDSAPEIKTIDKSTEKRDKAAEKLTDKSTDTFAPLPADARALAQSTLEINEITPSPDGKSVAWVTNSISHRMESPADIEIFLVPAAGGATRQLTHNVALEAGLHWSPDSHWLQFLVHAAGGSFEGKYQDVEGRIYRIDPADGKVDRLGTEFTGSFEDFAFTPSGEIVAVGLKGTQQQLYTVAGQKATKLPGLPGTYGNLSAPGSGNALLVQFSAINHPNQVYLASDALHPGSGNGAHRPESGLCRARPTRVEALYLEGARRCER